MSEKHRKHPTFNAIMGYSGMPYNDSIFAYEHRTS